MSFERQTASSAVSWLAASVPAGAYALTYEAVAATVGEFVLPPAHASLLRQPEVRGASAAGAFQVSRGGEFVAVAGGAVAASTCPSLS